MFPSFFMFPYVTTWSKTLSPLYIYIMCTLMPQVLTPLHGLWLHVAKTNNQLVHEVAVHNWGRRGRRWFPYKNNLHHPWSILTPTSPWSKFLEEIIQNGNFQLNPPPFEITYSMAQLHRTLDTISWRPKMGPLFYLECSCKHLH